LKPDDSYPYKTKGAHVCSLSGRERLLEILLKNDPDLEAVTYEENKGLTTSLVLAAWEGSLESCRLLLNAGANPNTWASAESPLYTAAEHHAWDKVELLVKYGAKHDIFTACICGELEIVESEIKAYRPLLERKSTKRNRTPLEEATEHQQDQVVKIIKELAP
jgi:ankyrin repeat protein